jgi:ribosome-associated toxin RatA of RatAB toxin-antitoxin module
MFQLVQDVERYPEFLSWCVAARLLERSEDSQLARLEVSLGGLRHAFTTRNRLEPAERLTLSLVDGPFRQLSGEWRFQPLGEQGCKIALELAFDFSSSMLSAAFRRGFSNVADRLVADFCRRADALHSRSRTEHLDGGR